MHDPHSERMSGSETRAASGLALVFAFRMLGMFMVLPVLATYGMDLAGATPALIGLAIGAYGLTQAIFQIPFGIISDRIGRRPVIYLGLIVFALGSVLAASRLDLGRDRRAHPAGRRGDFRGRHCCPT
jgi:MFS family permease